MEFLVKLSKLVDCQLIVERTAAQVEFVFQAEGGARPVIGVVLFCEPVELLYSVVSIHANTGCVLLFQSLLKFQPAAVVELLAAADTDLNLGGKGGAVCK